MRDKLLDLQVASAASTRSGMISNSSEIIEGTRESILELLEKPLLPNDNG